MKKILALVLALVMVLVVAAASAVKIEITRDDSYDGETGTPGNTYTAYKVFSASYTSNTSTGGNANADGTPGNVTGTATSASYTASSAVAAKLGRWVPAEGETAAHWEKATGNLWFNLTPIAGTTNFNVTWALSDTSATTAQAAAKWLLANSVYEGSGITLEFANGKWSKSELDAGYYIVEGGIGTNLIAATTDITVKEKNDYPPHDKTQADEDTNNYSHTEQHVAVGDVIRYEVSVTIPVTAKAGDRILVWDKQTNGLTYDNNVAVKAGTNTGNATISDPAAADVNASWAWSKLITVVDGSQGTNVVFAFTMTVNSNALVDSGKKNESGLKYGNENSWKYDSIPVHVEYKTYYAGIHKYDGTTTTVDLANVEFALKEAGVAFNVTRGSDGVYTPGGTSNTVITDSNGMIYIRGLDENKTYTLTETKALDGYNMLSEDVTLSLHEDTYVVDGETVTTSFSKDTAKTDSTWGQVANNKGTLLPSTGGIGTTIFYIIGGILLIGAAVILVARRKAHD